MADLKVSQLLERKFYIPVFQRGYRWQDREVDNLIKDINETEGKYFLNVLILQKRSDGAYNIVDGQQRLTTVVALLDTVGALGSGSSTKPIVDDLLKNGRKPADTAFINNVRTKNVDKGLADKLKNSYFLVYELSGDDPKEAEEVFLRINDGKIPLSTAELYKAYILGKEKRGSKKYLDAADKWDACQELLQKDDFFYFICPNWDDERYQASRMDYILELYYHIYLARGDAEKNYFSDKAAARRLYRDDSIFLYELLVEKNNVILVEEIKSFIDCLYYEWYKDDRKYHYLGYCMYKDRKKEFNPFIVFSELLNSQDDDWDLLKFGKEILGAEAKKQIEKLEKGSDQVYPLLLLYMVIRHSNEGKRFDFVKFYRTPSGWDEEHIHARNQKEYDINSIKKMIENAPVSNKNLKDEILTVIRDQMTGFESREWNDNTVYDLLGELNLSSLYKGQLNDKSDYLDLCARIINQTLSGTGAREITPFQEDVGWIDSIGNLTLLPASVNRSISNYWYPVKCEKIKEFEAEGKYYIPFCVAELYDKDGHAEWSEKERKYYFDKLCETLGLN